MENEIQAALLGAGGMLLAAAVPFALTAFADRRAKHLSARRSVLLGRWEGEGSDYYVEDSRKPKVTFRVVMTFTTVGHTVKGNAALHIPDLGEADDKLFLFGMFYNDDYLQLSYYNENLARKQLGVVVLGITPDGDALKGYYTGFSPRRETIVAGTIALAKKE